MAEKIDKVKRAEKAKKKENKVWSVMSVDLMADFPGEADVDVVGTWRSRRKAVDDCVDYIVERIALRPDIRYVMFHDVCHKDIVRNIVSASGVNRRTLIRKFDYNVKDGWEMDPDIEKALRRYLRDAFSVDNQYSIMPEVDDILGDSFTFQIVENQLKG